MDKAKDLGVKKISSLLARFAIPSVLSLVLHAAYSIVDRIFIGRGVGPLGLAGVTIAFPFLLILFGVCILFSSGAAALISLHLGEGDQEKAELVLGNMFTSITVVGIALFVFAWFFSDNLFFIFGMTGDALPYAQEYLKIILMGAVLFLFGFALTFVIRAEGNPVFSTLLIVLAAVVNVCLDYVFIFKFNMGTMGAALATVVSEIILVAVGLFYILTKQGLLRVHIKNLKLKKRILRKIIILGLSPAIMDVVSSLQCILLNIVLLAFGGTPAVATMGNVFSISSMIMLFTFGMAGGMQPIIGYNYGAGNLERVKETFLYSSAITFMISVGFVATTFIFSDSIAGWFCSEPELLKMTSHAMRIFLFCFPFATVSILTSRYYQAIGRGKTSIFIGLLRQIVVFVPVLILFCRYFHLEGVWYTRPFSDFISALMIAYFIGKELKYLSAHNVIRV